MPTARLLLIEEDPLISRALRLSLELQGYAVSVSDSFEAGLQCATSEQCDLVLLDLNLATGDGFKLCSELRDREPRLPILVMTTNANATAIVSAIEAGADDYLRKPCSVDELGTRVKRVLGKRSARQVRFGDLCIELDKNLAWVDGQQMHLGKREFSILTALVARGGHLLTLDEIADAINQHIAPYDRSTESYLSHLRKKLKGAGAMELIVPVFGAGYQLELT